MAAVVEDRGAFQGRLLSFAPGRWSHAATSDVLPVECARLGWEATAPDCLRCTECGAELFAPSPTLSLVELPGEHSVKLRARLTDRHKGDCVFRERSCPSHFGELPSGPAALLQLYLSCLLSWQAGSGKLAVGPKQQTSPAVDPRCRARLTSLARSLEGGKELAPDAFTSFSEVASICLWRRLSSSSGLASGADQAECVMCLRRLHLVDFTQVAGGTSRAPSMFPHVAVFPANSAVGEADVPESPPLAAARGSQSPLATYSDPLSFFHRPIDMPGPKGARHAPLVPAGRSVFSLRTRASVLDGGPGAASGISRSADSDLFDGFGGIFASQCSSAESVPSRRRARPPSAARSADTRGVSPPRQRRKLSADHEPRSGLAQPRWEAARVVPELQGFDALAAHASWCPVVRPESRVRGAPAAASAVSTEVRALPGWQQVLAAAFHRAYQLFRRRKAIAVLNRHLGILAPPPTPAAATPAVPLASSRGPPGPIDSGGSPATSTAAPRPSSGLGLPLHVAGAATVATAAAGTAPAPDTTCAPAGPTLAPGLAPRAHSDPPASAVTRTARLSSSATVAPPAGSAAPASAASADQARSEGAAARLSSARGGSKRRLLRRGQ